MLYIHTGLTPSLQEVQEVQCGFSVQRFPFFPEKVMNAFLYLYRPHPPQKRNANSKPDLSLCHDFHKQNFLEVLQKIIKLLLYFLSVQVIPNRIKVNTNNKSKCFVCVLYLYFYTRCQSSQFPLHIVCYVTCKVWMSHSSLYDTYHEAFKWQLLEACAHLLGDLSPHYTHPVLVNPALPLPQSDLEQ